MMKFRGVVLSATAIAIAAPGSALAADANTAGAMAAGADKAAAYWTPDRMASAKPVPMPRAEQAQSPAGQTAAGPSGPQVTVPGAHGAAGTSGANGVSATSAAATLVPRPYSSAPARMNGKVFFTKSTGGNFVCSGTAVNADNKSVVWTAGHCVHGGRGGGWHKNWVFVPAYSSNFNGDRPYGTWSARELWTKTEWINNSNFRQDVGAAVVNRINNIRLVDRIGGQGIRFNASRSQSFSAFGYPQASPFNGLYQYRCNSPRLADDFPPGAGPATIKIDCNMTGGSSGGGWLVSMTNGLGYVNSVNSYKYGSLPNNMFGPYHGNEALGLWNTVKVRPA